jgi:hypothetical protein
MFESNSRQNSVYFEYPYSEQDEITIELPPGFELESPDAPPVVKDNGGVGIDDIRISVSNDKRFIAYKRDFSFGNRGLLVFGKEVYPALKGLFEAFYKANIHALTLRQTTTAAATVKQ